MRRLLPRLEAHIRERQRAREVVATLALSLCKLRGLPALSERELDELMRAAVPGTRRGMAMTGEAGFDQLIICLDGLILERGTSQPQ